MKTPTYTYDEIRRTFTPEDYGHFYNPIELTDELWDQWEWRELGSYFYLYDETGKHRATVYADGTFEATWAGVKKVRRMGGLIKRSIQKSMNDVENFFRNMKVTKDITHETL